MCVVVVFFHVRRRWKVVGIVVAACAVALLVRSWLYHRYKGACESIEPGMHLDEAGELLERTGGKHVAVVDREHQWLRVRLSFKHQLCRVKVDSSDEVISVKYEDSWDLL